MKRFILFLLICFQFLSFCSYKPSESNLKARKWFEDARFGLFIHWGVYSQLMHHEWVMEYQKIKLKNYEQVASLFNPIKFNPSQWVSIAKAAGIKYITITTKHHDGFAMFATKQNKWNIVDHSPYGKDIMKMLADECHKQDIKLFFYYSQLDWYHKDYFPRGRTGNHNHNRPDYGDWKNYIKFMNNQLEELLTNYGNISGIWFDGWWDKPHADWDLKNTFDLIHQLQPHTLIGSNHHGVPFEGQDFQMFEQDLPGENTSGFGFEANTKISALPLETCLTINQKSWGVDLVDHKNGFKTAKELIAKLAGAAGRNSNLLLNVGPLCDGTFSSQAVELLNEMGKWLNINGESIYETKGGPLKPRPWGVTTQNGKKVYVHLLNFNNNDSLWLPLNKTINKCYYLTNKKDIDYTPSNNGVLLRDIVLYDPLDTVIVLEFN